MSLLKTFERDQDGGAENADALGAKGIRWDLGDLYVSPDDPQLQQEMDWCTKEAESFAAEYRGKIDVPGGPEPEFLAELLQRYEILLDKTYRTLSYANLVHSADSQKAEHGALLSKAQVNATKVQTSVMFFELDWIAIEDQAAEPILSSPSCSRWQHFLNSTRRYRPHTLSEQEEIILAEKSPTGSKAFQRLFDEFTSAEHFEVRQDGRSKRMNQSEALSLLYSPDRQLRRAAHRGFTKGLKRGTRLSAFVLNTLVQDHAVDCRLRKYSSPEASRHLANEIDQTAVDALISACESSGHIVRDYYRLKSKLMGIRQLYDYDRYAPVEIRGVSLPRCEWGTACQIVRESYQDFSEELGGIIQEFVSHGWVDAEPRPGKRGGAFCSPAVPSVHPYILMNFSGQLRDVMTLAHELGHGVHQYLARPLGILQAYTPLTLAETASVFGEMLVFNRLIDEQDDPGVKLSLICHRLEDAFATVFRQTALTRFERKVHEARGRQELSVEQLDEFWIEVNAEMLGTSVKLTKGYGRWWSYIGHFVHVPFYCYAYAFGELLVLALWRQYRREGSSFVPKYLNLLRAGGSQSPTDLIASVGLDINDSDFWESGLSVLGEMLDEAKQLAADL